MSLSRVKLVSLLAANFLKNNGTPKISTCCTERIINYPRCPTHHIPNAHLSLTASYSNKQVVSFDEVKNVPNNKNVILIDVREPSELQETGTIPGSINIPLGEVERVLKDTQPSEFLKRYGKEKPGPKTPIIFSCKMGKRSADAQSIAKQLGYTNAKNYLGGWQDWEEKNK